MITRVAPELAASVLADVYTGQRPGDWVIDWFFLDKVVPWEPGTDHPITPDHVGVYESICRYWDVLHYLFSETRRGSQNDEWGWATYPEPLAWSVVGASGIGVSDEDPSRELRMSNASQVESIAAALASSPSIEELANRFAAPADITGNEGYHFGYYLIEGREHGLRQMEEARQRLKRFYLEAAEQHLAVVHMIS